MSWTDCIERALTAKKIKGKKADEAREKYKALYDEARADGMADRAAQDWAAQHATQRIEVEAAERKKRQLAHMRKSIENWKMLKAGGVDQLEGRMRSIIEHDDQSPNLSYSTRLDRNRGLLMRGLAGFIERYGPKLAGLRHPAAGLDNIVREVFGENTGDASAQAFAKAWIDATDLAVRMFNYAGGTLPRLTDWRLPQHQSRVKLYKIGEEAWVADHMRWMDWDNMRWSDGSRIPVADRERALREAYKTLKTGGDVRITPGKTAGRNSLGNQFESSRFLKYKDAASWMEMHGKYGDGNVFETMIRHLDLSAHRISLVQAMGPNPAIMLEQVKAFGRKIAADADLARAKPPRSKIGVRHSHKDTADAAANYLDDAYKVITRQNHAPEGGHSAVFATNSAVARNLLTSSLLGAASLLAIPGDFATTAITKVFNRTPGMSTMRRYLALMRPGNSADRAIAIQSSLLAENATQLAFAQSRFTGMETLGPMFSRRISDVILRLSLLSPHTQAARWAFGMEMMGALARFADQTFDALPFKSMMERSGITAADWEIMRKVPAFEHKGAKFLRPDDLTGTGMAEKDALALADKFMAMIVDEGKFAVPDATIRALVTMRGATRSGTIVGELANSAALFKNFPLTILFTHMRRGLLQESLGGKLAYTGALIGGLTLVGLLGIQMREISYGRDPLPLNDWRTIGRAMLAGGGMGIWGDFLFSNVNRFGQGMGETAAGPVFPFLTDIRNLTLGNLTELVQGKETKALSETIKFFGRYGPGTSLWYARAALQNVVIDQLLKAADPKAASTFRAEERRLRKETGQGYWWEPGELTPERGPDAGRLVQ